MQIKVSQGRADLDLFYNVLQSEIGDLVNLVVQVERREDRRFVSHILQVRRFAVGEQPI